MQVLRFLLFLGLFFAGSHQAQSQVRDVSLLQAGQQDDGSYLLGLHLQLDNNWLTYWRQPGEAGFPPRVEADGAENLQALRLDFLAPQLFLENNITVLGYKNEVIFPLHVTAKNKNDPLKLKLAFHFGVCERICIPETRVFDVVLEKQGAAEAQNLIKQALNSVPKYNAGLFKGLKSEGGASKSYKLSVVNRRVYKFAVLEIENQNVVSIAIPERFGTKLGFIFKDLDLMPGKANMRITAVSEGHAETAVQTVEVK